MLSVDSEMQRLSEDLEAILQAGTVLLKQIASSSYPEIAGTTSSALFFVDNDGNNSSGGLWKTDGTLAGTVPVSQIGSTGGTATTPFCFDGNDSTHGTELWRSNGTPSVAAREREVKVLLGRWYMYPVLSTYVIIDMDVVELEAGKVTKRRREKEETGFEFSRL